MKTFEQIFREKEQEYRKDRQSHKHEDVIEDLALVVRSADEVLKNRIEYIHRLNGHSRREANEKREYKAAMYRFMYMAAVSVLANVILITLLMR